MAFMKKNTLMLIGSLCLIMNVSSCGKKASENKAPLENTTTGVETGTIEETHQEIQAAIISNDLATFKRLLDLKTLIDLNIILEDGETLLTTAVNYQRFEMTELLIENGGSVYKANRKKESPLMVAAKIGNEELVRLLISLGSKTDYKDINGNTALHLAILGKFETVALYLINSNTNIDITNNENQTALKLAEKMDLKKVIDLLRSLTQTNVGLPDKMMVRNLVTLGDVESLNTLFSKYPSIVHEYKDLNFFVLIMRSHPHDKALIMTQLLLSYGADANGLAENEATPLIEAVRKKYENFLKLFLEEGVNPNLQDKNGKTALIWAIEQNSASMVRTLIEKNAIKKYSYYVNGQKKKMSACDTARAVRKTLTNSDSKKDMEAIMDTLGCGLRWLF